MYILLEKISASAHLESIVSDKDLKNGVFVTLDEQVEDATGGEAMKVVDTKDGDLEVVLHASTPLTYSDELSELDFVLKAGKVGRGYHLSQGAQVAFSKDLVKGTYKAKGIVKPTKDGIEVVTDKPKTGIYGIMQSQFEDLNAGTMTSVKFFRN